MAARRRPRGELSPLRPVDAPLPLSHLRILATESRFLLVRRSHFLQLLLSDRLGLLVVKRPPHAPVYEFSEEEIVRTRRFVWHLRSELKDLFDRDRLRMGNVSPRDWIVLALNAWIACPQGLPLERSAA